MNDFDRNYLNKKRNERRKKIIRNRIILALALVFIVVAGVFAVKGIFHKDKKVAKTETKPVDKKTTTVETKPGDKVTNSGSDSQVSKPVEEKKPEAPKGPDEFEDIRIKAAGDILVHTPIKKHAYNSGKDGKSDFTKNFEEMKDFMKDADYTVANFEGTINPDRPLSDYPMFNVSKDILPTLKDIGIDGLTTANNHCLDTRFEGLESTIDNIDGQDIDYYGTQKTPDNRIKIVDVKNAKLAILAYTDNLNGMDPVLDTTEKKASVNMLEPETIKADIAKVREMGADIVIMYPHWGAEYTEKALPQYVDLARKMIDWGADVVCGNHPHVVQPTEWYTNPEGKKGWIIYSMGNFLSNQRVETMNGDIRTEQSVVVDMYFTKNITQNTTELKDVKIHPIWVRAYRDQFGGILNQTVLAEEYMKGGPKANKLNAEQLERANKAYKMTMKAVEAEVQ